MWIQQTRVPNSERSKCLEANDVIIVPGERALLWSAGLETLSEALRSSMPVFGHAAFVCDAVADDEDESLVRVSGRTWIPRALSHAPRPDLQSGLRGQSVFFLCPCDGSLMWGESGCKEMAEKLEKKEQRRRKEPVAVA
ncbi:hypothetical protein AOLI_G00073500 [Acnodon oligacanthus]